MIYCPSIEFPVGYDSDPIFSGFDAVDMHVFGWLLRRAKVGQEEGIIPKDVIHPYAICESCRITEELGEEKKAQESIDLIRNREFNGRRLIDEDPDTGEWFICDWDRYQILNTFCEGGL
jgi:hypothetical protein